MRLCQSVNSKIGVRVPQLWRYYRTDFKTDDIFGMLGKFSTFLMYHTLKSGQE